MSFEGQAGLKQVVNTRGVVLSKGGPARFRSLGKLSMGRAKQSSRLEGEPEREKPPMIRYRIHSPR